MKLEHIEKAILFSETSIPDIFFTEYLSSAKGDYIKVYLYIYFLAKYSKDISINDLHKKLSLPINIIEEALSFWEQEELLVKKPTGYIIRDIQQFELSKLYTPKVAISAEKEHSTSKEQYRARAVENINTSFFQGIMSPAWYGDISVWFSKYGFDEEVMIALFKYCFDKSALHKNYVKAVAEAWKNNDIKTFSELEQYFQKQEKINLLKKSISKKLRITRPLSEYEEGYITKWNLEFNYGMDIIEIALKKTTSKSNPNFNYLDKLLTDWHEKGYSSVPEIEEFLKSNSTKPKTTSTSSKKLNGYANYEQREYQDLDFLYSNISSENQNK